MDKVSARQVKGQWYDPRKGTWAAIGEYENAGNRKFEAPTTGEKDDWLLVLEDVARKFPSEMAK